MNSVVSMRNVPAAGTYTPSGSRTAGAARRPGAGRPGQRTGGRPRVAVSMTNR